EYFHRAPCPFLTGSFHRVIVVDASPPPVTAGAGDLIGGALNLGPHAAVRRALSSRPDQGRQPGYMRRGHRGTGQGIIPRVVAVPIAEETPVEVVLNGGENGHAGRCHVDPVRPVA